MNSRVRFTDVLYFLAELAVYVAVAWWGAAREVPVVGRVLLGVGCIVVFATAWAVFAAPGAPIALEGAADIAFRIAWFGLGTAAGLALIFGH